MANIKQHLSNIKNALFGHEVRGSIHDGIDSINKEVESTTGRQQHLEGTFEQLIINEGNSNAEIVAGRVKEDGTQFPTIGKRIADSEGKISVLDSQLEHIENEIPFLNVLKLGVKNDGTDTTDMLQSVINNNNQATLFFPKGTYVVSKTIRIDNEVSLQFESGAILTTNEELNSLIEYNTSYSSKINRTFKNLVLDGNNKVNTVLNIIGASSLYIDDITVLNPKLIGIDVNSDGISKGSTHEVYINNCKIVNKIDMTSSYNAIGLLVRTSDCNFTNIVPVNMKIGIKVVHGANVFTRIHPWINETNIFENSIGIRNEAVGNTFNDCYMDTVFKGFSSKSEAIIKNFNFRISDSMMQSLISNPIFIEAEYKEILAENCYFENAKNHTHNPIITNNSNIKLISPRISLPNYFNDNPYKYNHNYIQTYRCNFSNFGINPGSYQDKEKKIEGIKYNDVFTYNIVGQYLNDGLILNVFLKDNFVTVRIYNTTNEYITINKLSIYITIIKKNQNEILDYITID